MGTLFDPQYPPKNRVATVRSPLDLEIEDAQRKHSFDPNGLVLAVFQNQLELGPAVQASDLSGAPGYLYRAEDVEIALTIEEIRRLVLRALTPEEYFKLRTRYGVFFEIHDDFYDSLSGAACQPKA
ncbi:hypothetical protein [Thioalkalivibrio thiocyanodenitrificans]|uniref:hypothetical protein n=1 Tax=Thioalkalivibrio thiocyanodenitrificans TaxID=243063 RepID=UPI00037103F8|nr:hypothetical protein [Thioalkalivibrio thiocyanodenitrificans]